MLLASLLYLCGFKEINLLNQCSLIGHNPNLGWDFADLTQGQLSADSLLSINVYVSHSHFLLNVLSVMQ